MSVTIGITGASGLIGSKLLTALDEAGYRLIIFKHTTSLPLNKGNQTYTYWNYRDHIIDTSLIAQVDGFIHLAGAGIADKRWTTARKLEILQSRQEGTSFISKILMKHAPNCKVFLGASAIGYYGSDQKGQGPFVETDVAANDFLGSVCQSWEQASEQLSINMRRVIFRTGIVFSNDGGALPQLTQSLNYRIATIIGNGHQHMSWIHLDDLVQLYLQSITNTFEGIYNAVAPEVSTLRAVMRQAAKELGTPWLTLRIPEVLLKWGLGEMGTELLKSQNVSSNKLLQASFKFKFPNLKAALDDLL